MKKLSAILTLIFLLLFSAKLVFAEGVIKSKKTYKEMEFIQIFKGKPQQFVLDTLGEPIKKQVPTKPKNADSYVGKPVPNGEKQDVIEMWYYPNLVLYNSKDTFKKTEMTFVNDKCTNFTFVN